AAIIRKGVPGTAMQPFNFSEQQAGMVVAYLRSFAGTGTGAAADTASLGDAARGKALFEGSKANCLRCHRVGERGCRVGPHLTSTANPRPPTGRGPPPPPPSPAAISQQLQQSLVDPDADVTPANRTFRAVLKDGSAVTGRLLNLDPFTVLLFDSKERLVTLQ